MTVKVRNKFGKAGVPVKKLFTYSNTVNASEYNEMYYGYMLGYNISVDGLFTIILYWTPTNFYSPAVKQILYVLEGKKSATIL